MPAPARAVALRLARLARPLAEARDPAAPLDDLAPLGAAVGGAAVVALGAACRQARETAVLAHRMIRRLVELEGFRAVALEGDDVVRTGLAAYVRDGAGDARELLAAARPFWRLEEVLAVVRWLRAFNERHPHDPVRLVHGTAPAPAPAPGRPLTAAALAAFDRRAADETTAWHERTGDRVVYWGGLGHTAVVHAPPAHHPNVGGLLRRRLGDRYVSVGLTFDHGAVPFEVPAPPPEYVEAALGSAGPDAADACLLDLRTARAEPDPAVRAWLAAPAPLRVVGPSYDPAREAAHRLTGAAPATWCDLFAHVREATAARPFAAPARVPAPRHVR